MAVHIWLFYCVSLCPPTQTVSEKERIIINEVKIKEPVYFKGDYTTTARIAENYPTAVINGEKTLHNLLPDGLLGMEDTDERNRWLHSNCKTFSNVYEAIRYLKLLK